MKLETITRILEGTGGVRKDGGTWLVPDEVELSVYFGLEAEMLTVNRVSRLQLTPELVTVETAKGERFFFPPESIAGLKAGISETKGPRSTGFR